MKIVKPLLFILGIFLLAINITGLFRSLRNPAIYTEENNLKNRVADITIKYPDIKKLLLRKPGEANEDFAVRINKVVNDGFSHYWKDDGIDKYYERVPAWENYLLFVASYIDPKEYR